MFIFNNLNLIYVYFLYYTDNSYYTCVRIHIDKYNIFDLI